MQHNLYPVVFSLAFMFDVLACLKDLIRFLRVDDATCEIRRQLGRSQAVEKVLKCTQGYIFNFWIFSCLLSFGWKTYALN